MFLMFHRIILSKSYLKRIINLIQKGYSDYDNEKFVLKRVIIEQLISKVFDEKNIHFYIKNIFH